METKVSEYIDIEQKAVALGLNSPTGLAILPRNFDTATRAVDLIDESTTPTIRSLWRQAGVTETRLEKEGVKIPQGSKKSWEWISPLIFISQAMLNNTAVPMTLNIISNYLYDILKGHLHNAEVTLEFVVETEEQTKYSKKKLYKRLTIKGTPKELKAFGINELKELAKEATQ